MGKSTIQDVARLAGVSEATATLRFSLSKSASALASGKTHRIMLISGGLTTGSTRASCRGRMRSSPRPDTTSSPRSRTPGRSWRRSSRSCRAAATPTRSSSRRSRWTGPSARPSPRSTSRSPVSTPRGRGARRLGAHRRLRRHEAGRADAAHPRPSAPGLHRQPHPPLTSVLLHFFLSNFCTVFPQYGLPVSSRNCTIWPPRREQAPVRRACIFPRRSQKTNPPVAAGGAREGKDDGDADAQTARYQETGPSGSVQVGDREEAGRGPRHGRETR